MTKTRMIFLPPPLSRFPLTYQNVNADPQLRKNVTDHYFDLLPQLVKEDNRFKKLKKHLKMLQTRKGYDLVYKILRRYTRKYDINWYDLRSQNQDTLDYLSRKMIRVLHM